MVVSTHLDEAPWLDFSAQLDSDEILPAEVRALFTSDEQAAVPAIAKQPLLMHRLECIAGEQTSRHSLLRGDARHLESVPNASVHLVVTSPPYWNLKQYEGSEGQLGDVEEYDEFLSQLDQVWREVHRVLVPGGRLIVVVGDVCVPRRKFGRHMVFPLHASIQEHCRVIGLDNLAPIIWHKISNASLEAKGNGASFLGKPYEPGGVIKNDIEFILMQRKGGGYRQPSIVMRALSILSEPNHRRWFQQIWDIKGASTRHHPAPFPLELAERLVRMFSFVGDTILDPFAGTGTTNVAAAMWGRHSIGVEIEPLYHAMALKRLRQLQEQKRTRQGTLIEPPLTGLAVGVDAPSYD